MKNNRKQEKKYAKNSDGKKSPFDALNGTTIIGNFLLMIYKWWKETHGSLLL